MAQAAALLDRPFAELQAAKRAGCPAFLGGRVDLAAYLDWIAENPSPQESLDLKDPDERYRIAAAKKLELQVKILEGQYTRNDILEKDLARMLNAFRASLTTIPKRAAQTCAGRAALEVERILSEFVEEALAHLNGGKWSARQKTCRP